MKTLKTPAVIDDTIIIRSEESMLLYSQNTKQIARVSDLNNQSETILKERGFFSQRSLSTCEAEENRCTSLMLLLGKKCPLRCVYCYADGGVNGGMMDIEVADRAISYYLALRPSHPRVVLFGAGEPTLNMIVIKYAVEKYGPSVRWVAATSGAVSPKALEWMIEREIVTTFSVDGPPFIQDQLRPLKNGFRSSPIVEQSLRLWKEKSKKPLAIRTTLTNNTVRYLDDILGYFQNIGVDKIHLEPVYGLGRGGEGKEAPLIPPEVWAYAAVQALEWAKKMGKRIQIGELSYLFQPVADRPYCGPLSGSTIVVNHKGDITACSEVDDELNENWPAFRLGSLQEGFKIDTERAKRFASRCVRRMDACRNCFVRNVCRGGCAHKGLVKTGNIFVPNPDHCIFMRTVVPQIIRRMADGTYNPEKEGGENYE